MFNSKTLYNLKKVFNYLPHKRRKELLSLIPLSIFAGISEVIVLGLLARLLNFIVGQPREAIPIFSNLFNYDPKYKIIILICWFRPILVYAQKSINTYKTTIGMQLI